MRNRLCWDVHTPPLDEMSGIEIVGTGCTHEPMVVDTSMSDYTDPNHLRVPSSPRIRLTLLKCNYPLPAAMVGEKILGTLASTLVPVRYFLEEGSRSCQMIEGSFGVIVIFSSSVM